MPFVSPSPLVTEPASWVFIWLRRVFSNDWKTMVSILPHLIVGKLVHFSKREGRCFDEVDVPKGHIHCILPIGDVSKPSCHHLLAMLRCRFDNHSVCGNLRGWSPIPSGGFCRWRKHQSFNFPLRFPAIMAIMAIMVWCQRLGEVLQHHLWRRWASHHDGSRHWCSWGAWLIRSSHT